MKFLILFIVSFISINIHSQSYDDLDYGSLDEDGRGIGYVYV
jgi:hypothetical protein